jgi:acetolactate synthase-1/2/3 large subunit
VAAATGCLLVAETFPGRMERGGALPRVERLPYLPEMAEATLARGAGLVTAGASDPVAFFLYEGGRSRMAPDGMPVHELATVADDAVDALERLAERLGARDAPPPAGGVTAAPADDRPLDAQAVAAILAAAQPEGAIVVDEGITLSQPYFDAAAGSPAHTYLAVTGGAIGQGLPTAAGAACACPDRPVIAFQADGSGLYTLQALWTMAREQLDVTVLIAANRSYAIIQLELARAGDGAAFGAASEALSRLADPAPDWVALAAGMGVPAARASTAGELGRELARALAEPGPHLVEMVL